MLGLLFMLVLPGLACNWYFLIFEMKGDIEFRLVSLSFITHYEVLLPKAHNQVGFNSNFLESKDFLYKLFWGVIIVSLFAQFEGNFLIPTILKVCLIYLTKKAVIV